MTTLLRSLLGRAALGLVLCASVAPAAVGAEERSPKKKRASSARAKKVPEAELGRRLVRSKGKPVVLHFWATWCKPCLRELPTVARLRNEARERGVELIVFSLDASSPEGLAIVDKTMDEYQAGDLPREVLDVADPDTFVRTIDPRWQGNLPAFFAYDSEGRLRRAFIGLMNDEHFDKFVTGLTASRP